MDEHLKSIAKRTAQLLAETGDKGLMLTELLGRMGESPDVSSSEPDDESEGPPSQIGIWRRHVSGGEVSYVRLPYGVSEQWQWQRWADVEVIPPKGSRRRIVYLGESVARGYFFEPYYTPAKVLESMLGRHIPEGAEVIDLAATDLGGRELLDLLSQSSALEPDAIVVFAGNNWAFDSVELVLQEPMTRQLAAAVLRKDGFAGFNALLQGELSKVVGQHLSMLSDLARSMNVPVVVVVPEFNLLDWNEIYQGGTCWMHGDVTDKWWAAWRVAQDAWKKNEFDAAAAAARTMVELDGACSPHGLTMLGKCLQRVGRPDEARRYLELGRDCRLYVSASRDIQSPRCYAGIQQGLRSLADDQVTVVDLPSVLATWTGGELPGRRLFMDYCHLSAEGIGVAMAATVRALLATADAPSMERLVNESGSAPAEIEAMAYVVAAIHNAHWGQEHELVVHHLRRAMSLSAPAVNVLRNCLEMQGRGVPRLMTVAAGEVLSNKVLSYYMLCHNAPQKFDEPLVDAIVEAVNAEDPKAHVRVEEIRADEWGCAPGRPLDLICRALAPNNAFSWPYPYRAFTPVSRFVLPAAGPAALQLTVTCRRTAFSDPKGPCVVQLNGQQLAELELNPRWTTSDIAIPAGLLRRGTNELRFLWPAAERNVEQAIDHAAAEIEAGRHDELWADVQSGFGDIHMLRVSG